MNTQFIPQPILSHLYLLLLDPRLEWPANCDPQRIAEVHPVGGVSLGQQGHDHRQVIKVAPEHSDQHLLLVGLSQSLQSAGRLSRDLPHPRKAARKFRGPFAAALLQ